MAESVLLKLVGDDPEKADELITVIADLALTFLTAKRQKGEGYAKRGQQNQGSTFKPLSDRLHTAIDPVASTPQP